MKLEKRSDYANYLVLSDKSNNKLGSTFEKFLNFKKVKEVLNNMAFTDKSTFAIDGNMYPFANHDMIGQIKKWLKGNDLLKWDYNFKLNNLQSNIIRGNILWEDIKKQKIYIDSKSNKNKTKTQLKTMQQKMWKKLCYEEK